MIKLVFGLALLLFILWKVERSYSNEEFSHLTFVEGGLGLIVLTISLMPLNWMLETIKWHLLVKTFGRQSFGKSFLDVLAGISTSLITPNRIGNFIGRSLGLEKVVRTKAVMTTIHSNLAQFVSSISFGLVGLFLIGFDQPYIDEATLHIASLVLLMIGLFIFFNPAVLDFNPLSKMYSEQVKIAIRHVQEEKVSLKTSILFLSVLRYFVFLLQFYLLLLAFGVSGQAGIIVPAIALVFLITTIMPSFLFGKLFVREAAALIVLGSFGVDTPIILATAFLLWIINLGFPSLIGAAILLKRKY